MMHLLNFVTHLLHGSLHNDPDAGWKIGQGLLQQTAVRDAILLKAVEKGWWCVLHLRLLNDHHTLKVRIHTRGFCVSPNGNVGIVASTHFWIINLTKALVEEVIEALMYVICLDHDHCVAFDGRVTAG